MEDAYQKYRFSAISIKKDVAVRFRAFSRLVSDSHTRTLEAIMNFFEWNDLHPTDDLGLKNNRTNKRINAVIAILKNIEKYQTLPTKAMLDSLFHEMAQVEEKETEEEVDFPAPETFTRDRELEQYRERYEDMQQQLGRQHNHLRQLLARLTYIKGTFGKGHYKLDMDKNELEQFKTQLHDVHHDHRTEG